MSNLKKLLLIAIISLSINQQASADPYYGLPLAVATLMASGGTAMLALNTYFANEARNHVLKDDPNYSGTPSVTRSLMGTIVTSGAAAGFSGIATLSGLMGPAGAMMSVGFLVASEVFSVTVPMITSTIAFGIEDNHKYGPHDLKGSSDQNLKNTMGLSWTAWIPGTISLCIYHAISGAKDRATQPNGAPNV